MSYSSDPVQDADRHISEQAKYQERLEAMIKEASYQIEQGFKSFTIVPFTHYGSQHAKGRLRYMPFAEAVDDLIADRTIFNQFVEVLKTSECPKVKALLDAMTEKHKSMWAEEVGRAML